LWKTERGFLKSPARNQRVKPSMQGSSFKVHPKFGGIASIGEMMRVLGLCLQVKPPEAGSSFTA